MPELPEVETVRRGLAPVLEGKRLAHVWVGREDLRFPFPRDFSARLTNARVRGVGRRAKYLLLDLDTGETLVSHLGMSGRFTAHGARTATFHHESETRSAHTHVVFETGDGVSIEYSDPRRFGYMDLIATDTLQQHPWFSALGPEPLGNGFHAAHLTTAFAGKRQNVKSTLLDQRVVAGLGNIYVCEALHRSGISPTRPAGRIARARLETLAVAVREVLLEAIDAGGSTLRDFAQADGELGYFQHRFRAYDREGEPCSRCQAPIVRIVQGGRSTFYCRRCQK